MQRSIDHRYWRRLRRCALAFCCADCGCACSCRRQTSLARRALAHGARALRALVPFYEYGEARVLPRRRRAGRGRGRAARRLHAPGRRCCRRASPSTAALTAEVRRRASPTCSSPPATACRSSSAAIVREHLKAGAFVARLRRRDGHRSRRQPALRPDRLLRRQRLRLRLLQGVHRARRRARARPGPGARRLSSGGRLQRAPAAARSPACDEVSFHMSGTEAVMQAVRLARYHTGRSHLVRFCGAYHGWWGDVQPGVGNPLDGARHLHAEGHGRGRAAGAAQPARHRLRAGQSAAGAASERQRAPGDSTLVDSGRGAHFDRAAYAAWLRKLREVCTARDIVLIFDEVFVGFRLARGRRAGVLRRARRHGHLRQDRRRRTAGRRAVRPRANYAALSARTGRPTCASRAARSTHILM